MDSGFWKMGGEFPLFFFRWVDGKWERADEKQGHCSRRSRRRESR
jgi:hypothetical protein